MRPSVLAVGFFALVLVLVSARLEAAPPFPPARCESAGLAVEMKNGLAVVSEVSGSRRVKRAQFKVTAQAFAGQSVIYSDHDAEGFNLHIRCEAGTGNKNHEALLILGKDQQPHSLTCLADIDALCAAALRKGLIGR